MYRSTILFSLALVGFVGCGGSNNPATVPVSGVVTYKNKPVEGADVTFVNDRAPRYASGKTDANGKYSLTTYSPNDGVIPGECRVTVVKTAGVAAPVTDLSGADYEAAMKQAAKGGPKSALPTKYRDPNSSGIVKMIKADGGPITNMDIELTD